MPVLRSSKNGDDYDPKAFDVYGPKILSTRLEFEDHALETRCLTLGTVARALRDDIPRQLPPAFHAEALALRNKLLRWRFENFHQIQADESQLLAMEPRLTQICAPLYAVSQDSTFRAELLNFLLDQADEQRADTPQAIVAEAIRDRLKKVPKWPAVLKVGDVATQVSYIRIGSGMDANGISARRCGTVVRSLGFEPKRTHKGYEFTVTQKELDELVSRYHL